MTWFLASLPTPLLVLIVVGLCVGLSSAGLLLVRSRVHHSILAEHNDIAGFIFATVGVTYAVILALVAIAVWEEYQAAEGAARREAAITLTILREAEALPESIRREIQANVRDYVRAVVDDEWPLMASGRFSMRAERSIEALWGTVSRFDPATTRESNWHDHTIGSLRNLSDVREERLTSLQREVPLIVWVVLILGGALTIGYTYLYGVRRPEIQLVLTATLAALTGLALSLIVALDHPFTGDSAVTPEAFHAAHEEMDRRLGSRLD